MTDSEMNVLKSSDRLKQEIKCMRFIDFHRILYTVRLDGTPLSMAIGGIDVLKGIILSMLGNEEPETTDNEL